jgi:hypothetical protein
MDLIERYLAAIGRQLPARQAADIENELRDVLLSRVEEQEARHGRPLQRAELESLLIDFGHPLVVAARYRKTQHLIGPEIFPFWLTAIQWEGLILSIVFVVFVALAIMMGRSALDLEHGVYTLIQVGISLFGWITVIFASWERSGKAGFLRNWKPSRLPPPERGLRPRFAIATEIAVNVVFILWWQGLIRFQPFFPYPVHLSVALAPVWIAWHWEILAYAVLGIAADLVALARPGWSRTNTGLRVGRYLYGVAILGFVFQAGHWVEVSSPVVAPQVLQTIQTNFDLGMRVGIGCAVLGMLVQVGLDLWRAYRRQGGLGVAAQA